MSKTIGIYGAASDAIDQSYKDHAFTLCRELAMSGYHMVYGGGSTGLMGAAARGFTAGMGRIIGVVPRFMGAREPAYEQCTKTVTVDSMAERKSVMEGFADLFLILPGGIGTLDEFYQIATQISLGRKDAKVVVFNDRGFYDSTKRVIAEGIEKRFIGADLPEYVFFEDGIPETLGRIHALSGLDEQSILSQMRERL